MNGKEKDKLKRAMAELDQLSEAERQLRVTLRDANERLKGHGLVVAKASDLEKAADELRDLRCRVIELEGKLLPPAQLPSGLSDASS